MSSDNTSLGDRMKEYEMAEAGRKLMPFLPAIIRLDGKGFSKWTSKLQRPYEEGLSNLMVKTTKSLVELTNANIGYTQSDEITLILYSDDYESELYFGGRIQKLTSILSSHATAIFNSLVPTYVPSKAGELALFDCRVFNVPSLEEAANAVLWREQDATKNSISMAAQAFYSHNQLQNKNGKEKQDMLMEKGINWNDFPAFFKRGTYLQRKLEKVKFSTTELEKLPKSHAARKNPDLEIERHVVTALHPQLGKVSNRVGFIFRGETPLEVKQTIEVIVKSSP